MFKRFAVILISSMLAFASLAASAIEVFIDPASQNVTIGDPVSIDVNISGLGAFSSPSLGSYDIDVMFDPSLLAFTGVTFGTELDLLGFGFNPTGVAEAPLGTVNIFEISLDLASDLDSLQSDAFTLFSMSFNTLAVGTSVVDMSSVLLADSLGDTLVADVVDGEITIDPATVPEPGALVLLTMGLLGFRATSRAKRNLS